MSIRPRTFALVTASVLLSRGASAEPLTREQLAQDLFDQARRLVASDGPADVTRACQMFAESQRLDPGAGTFLNLALCHEKEGKLGTAHFELEEALSQARRDKRADRESIATSHLEALAPRIPKLVVVAPAVEVPGLSLELDGVPLASAALGVAVPVDLGVHTLRASANGRTPWTWEGTLAERDVVRVEVPALPEVAPPRTTTTRSLSTASYVTFGLSAALLVTSGITGVVSLREKSIYEDRCVPSRGYCADGGADAQSEARTFAWVSTVTLVGGAAAAVTAYFLPRNVQVSPQIGPGTAGLYGSGSF